MRSAAGSRERFTNVGVGLVAILVGVGVAAAVLTTGSSGLGEPPTDQTEVCPVAHRDKPATEPLPYDSRGDDYAGPPPHPVTVMDTMDGGRLSNGEPLRAKMALGYDEYPFYLLPKPWQPPETDDPDGPPDRSHVQLVACLYYAAIEKPRTRCHYQSEDGTFRIAPARFTVVVREANSARTVDTFELRSNPRKVRITDVRYLRSEFCPMEIPMTHTEGPHTWLLPPRNADVLDGLRPLVRADL